MFFCLANLPVFLNPTKVIYYEQFYSTPDRMKINSGPGATQSGKTPDGKYISIPVWEGIFLRYAVNNHFSRADKEYAPSTSYYKHNYLTFKTLWAQFITGIIPVFFIPPF